jgi:hypothetical protein
MTSRQRLRATRGVLAGGVAAKALLWAAAMGSAALLLGQGTALGPAAAAAAAVFTAAIVAWRGRAVRSELDVALWVEERPPVL